VSLLILAVVILFLIGLSAVLLWFLQQVVTTSSQRLLDSQVNLTTSTTDLSTRMHSILVNSIATQSEAAREQFLQILTPVLNQQELLVNRLLAKDAIAATQLDQRLLVAAQEQSTSDGYFSGSDDAELEAFDRSGTYSYANAENADDKRNQDDSGMFVVHPGDG
jgi:hypothetical protein